MSGANGQPPWVGLMGSKHGWDQWATSMSGVNGQSLLELLGTHVTCPVHSVIAMSN